MKFLFLFLFLVPIRCYSQNDARKIETIKERVLICNTPGAYAYHSDSCKGLKNCNGKIIRIELKEAIRERKPCKYCYKRKK